MSLLITALLLFFGACALAILHLTRPRFRFSWLLAVSVALVAFAGTLIMRAQLPSALDVPLWKSLVSVASFASFSVTDATWPVLLSLTSVALAAVLAAPGRTRFPDPISWAICLGLCCVGLLALSAEGPLTLVLLWATLDLMDAGLVVGRQELGSSGANARFAFGMRIASIGLVMLGFVLGDPSTSGTKFAEIESPGAVALLQVAALVRVCSFAIPRPRQAGAPPEAAGTMLQLTAGAASVGYLALVRPLAGSFTMSLLCALAALYAGWMFLRLSEFREAGPLWIMGIGSLAVAASAHGNPVGATGWTCSLLLAGCSLFLNSFAKRWSARILLLAMLMISALPFTLTAAAWAGASGPSMLTLPITLAGQAMLLAGSYHKVMRSQGNSALRMEVLALRGVQYAALGLPLLVGILLGLWGWPGAALIGAPLSAVLVLPAAAGLAWIKLRVPGLNPSYDEWLPKWTSNPAALLARETNRIGRTAQRLTGAMTSAMEGEAGIMWGLLFVVLFVSLIARSSP